VDIKFITITVSANSVVQLFPFSLKSITGIGNQGLRQADTQTGFLNNQILERRGETYIVERQQPGY
jgi:hypothetical protein